jgi:phosphoglycolate phosphatase
MNSNKQYPLLVFDWDGTLVDSIRRIVTSLQYASKTAIDVDISENHARSVIGLGLVEAVAALLPELDQDQHSAELERVADAYRQHYLYENEIEAPLFDGVDDMLEALRSKGYTLAVATGKSRAGLDHALRDHGFEALFAITRTPTESRSKPDPAMLNEIMAKTAFSPQHTLMIGDSEHDLKMATNAGVASIAVTHGVHGRETLQKHSPLTCLDRISGLDAYLHD